MVFAIFFISGIIFFMCLISAAEKKKGAEFFGVALLTLVLLAGLAFVGLGVCFEGSRGGGWAIFIYGFFIAQALPGIASIIAWLSVCRMSQQSMTDEQETCKINDVVSLSRKHM